MGETERNAAGTYDQAARSRRFQQLALPHLDAAYNLARWLCGNASDADDVVQEAFMRAFRFFDTFRGDSARPWLLAIVRRTWYTEWRRRASAHEVGGFDDSQEEAAIDGWSPASVDPQTLAIREEDSRLVHAALERLPVEYREVLILRELEELSYREIATIADLPVGTVMSRLARGRRKLAAALTALEARESGPARQRKGAAAGNDEGAPAARQPGSHADDVDVNGNQAGLPLDASCGHDGRGRDEWDAARSQAPVRGATGTAPDAQTGLSGAQTGQPGGTRSSLRGRAPDGLADQSGGVARTNGEAPDGL
ncbi:RNA polymerase sigma factor [Paraburkholderia sp. BL10I2N1]|uniref:RNA polymerase sigma factor n=1 Tax=Paraburkholderia sp. BL10I2N1 TaxID=1938796 RepID=UPI00105C147B|nr:RNA polymerase sigma factor [Paraburkholderia sp. BL10I2N1]TDN70342.1 RNA polymerase sigma-70 factor (ECF subfamily) [Paraburkholderia sp. BL10I2N1]